MAENYHTGTPTFAILDLRLPIARDCDCVDPVRASDPGDSDTLTVCPGLMRD
jgi:hypothetical protein